MKLKRILSLALSGVLAVSMLAALAVALASLVQVIRAAPLPTR